MIKWVVIWVLAWTLVLTMVLASSGVWCGLMWCGPWWPEKAVSGTMTLWVILMTYALIKVVVIALARAIRDDNEKRPS